MHLDQLLQHRFDNIDGTVTPRDAMLYALGIGVGDQPGGRPGGRTQWGGAEQRPCGHRAMTDQLRDALET